MGSQQTARSILPSIGRVLRGERREIWVVVIYGLGIGLFSLIVPIAVQTLVGAVAFGSLLQPVVVLALCVLAGLSISAIMEVLQLRVVEFIQRRIYVRISLDLARRIPLIVSDLYRTTFTPQLVNRYLEVFSVQKSIFQILLEGVAVALQTVLGMILLMFYHPYLLVFSFLIVGSVLFIYLVLSRGAVRTAIDESNAKYEVVAWLEDIASHPLLFKSKDGLEYAIRRSDEVTNNWIECRETHFRILLREKAAALIVQALGAAGMLGIGGYLVINEQLSLGQLVAAEIVVSIVLNGITKFTKQVEYFYELASAVSKLDSLTELEYESPSGDTLPPPTKPMNVELKGLELRRGTSIAIPDLVIPSGAKIAIFGKNGSGKSLLADAFFGLEPPTAGSIRFDGHDLRDLSITSLRSEVYLVRGIEIFHGTIRENLALSREDLSGTDLRSALESVGLREELELLPDGLETVLNPTGSPLSRGQRFRLMLARALLRTPKLLIVDETLDGIDEEELSRVFATLLSKDAPWTLIVLTHDREVLAHFETQFALDGGALMKRGEHA